jgi:hypothetical protein
MFSFLETVRLQGGDAIAQLCELLSLAGRSPPGLQATQTSRLLLSYLVLNKPWFLL